MDQTAEDSKVTNRKKNIHNLCKCMYVCSTHNPKNQSRFLLSICNYLIETGSDSLPSLNSIDLGEQLHGNTVPE